RGARWAAVRGAIVAIRLPGERHLTGTLWQPDVVVASEQSLPKRNELELIMPGGSAQGGTVSAKVAGRDPGTNIALLRLAQPVSLPPLVSGPAEAGALALAFGADGVGGTSVRMGAINQAGPEGTGRAGGRLDQRMVMSIVDGGPAAKAGIVAGDIVLTVNGIPTRRLRRIATHLASESIGRNADLRVIRGGRVLSVQAVIEARPPA